MLEKVVNYSSPSLDLQASSGVPQSISMSFYLNLIHLFKISRVSVTETGFSKRLIVAREIGKVTEEIS